MNPADRTILCCRALIEGERGATETNLRDALGVLRPHAGKAALTDACRPLLRALVDSGVLEQVGKRYVLADAERTTLREQLGIGGTSPKWTALRDVQILAHALGLPAPDAAQAKRIKSAAGCRAAVLAAAHRLDLPDYPIAAEVLDALTWNRLAELSGSSVEPWRKHKVGGGKVVCFLLLDPLGVQTPKSAGQMLGLLAATAVGAVGDGVPALRSAVLQSWHARGPLRSATRATGTPVDAVDGTTDLVAALREIARTEHLERRADRAVFVATLHDALLRRRPDLAVDLESFKARLLDAARAGHARLIRADLVEAMDPALVARSEIRDLHARFHLAILAETSR